MQRQSLNIVAPGQIPYRHALALQQRLIDSEDFEDQVYALFMQHPRVVTLGKHAQPDDLLLKEEEYVQRGIEVVQVDRGGQVTAHMPGQLVLWPLLKMNPLESVRKWVSMLEQVVIDTVKLWGIDAHRDPKHPGVWVGEDKLCAIGLRIQNRYSTHGIALNVSNHLDVFHTIVPCGLPDRGVVTMEGLVSRTVDIQQVQTHMACILAQTLKCDTGVQEPVMAMNFL